MKQSKMIIYSEAFKRQIVDGLSSGRILSINAARKTYNINGGDTINKWIKKYGREDLLPKRIRIETLKEVDQLKEARKRIRTLEAALADAHIDNCLEHAFLEIACERMGTELTDFKKKNELTLSDVRKMRVKK